MTDVDEDGVEAEAGSQPVVADQLRPGAAPSTGRNLAEILDEPNPYWPDDEEKPEGDPPPRRTELLGVVNVYQHREDLGRAQAFLKAGTDGDRRYAGHEDWDLVDTITRTPEDYQ